MNLSLDSISAELPSAPNAIDENEMYEGKVDAAAFDLLYGAYRGTEHYEDARKVFLHPKLNRYRTIGVNTWHEQVLAGRVTVADLKVMGYGRLNAFRGQTTSLLLALTHDAVRATPKQLGAAMTAAASSLMCGLNPPMSQIDVELRKGSMRAGIFALALHYVQLLDGFDLRGVRFYQDIHDVAGIPLSVLAVTDPERAWKLFCYVDDFMSAFTYSVEPGKAETYHYVSGKYGGAELLALMDAGITPDEAVDFLRRGFPADRAFVAHGISSAVVEGMI